MVEKKLKKRKVGRKWFDCKTIAEQEKKLAKLEYAFLIGATDAEACFHADISIDSLFRYQKAHPEFHTRKKLLKKSPIFKARLEVIKGLKGDPRFAMIYLEKKRRKEFGDLPADQSTKILILTDEQRERIIRRRGSGILADRN